MVAGISLAMPLFIVSQGIGNIFGMGASSYISRLLGARRGKETKQTCSAAFWTTFGMGLLITVAQHLAFRPNAKRGRDRKDNKEYAHRHLT